MALFLESVFKAVLTANFDTSVYHPLICSTSPYTAERVLIMKCNGVFISIKVC